LELTERLPYFSSLSAPRQAVLIDMAFNLGVGGLMKFTNTLAAVEAGDFAKAAERMMQSKWATQVKRRAFRLAKMMETGEWPSFLG
jgi:lysozyme